MATNAQVDQLFAFVTADNHDQAAAMMKAGWDKLFYAAIARLLTRSLDVTSASSVSIGTGEKTFVLAETRFWREGTPVFIVETGSPVSNYMVGKLTTDESGLSVTVDVTNTGGSGTFTSWRL